MRLRTEAASKGDLLGTEEWTGFSASSLFSSKPATARGDGAFKLGDRGSAVDAVTEPPHTTLSLADSHEEDFVENQGNPQMMSDQLKRKTVLELKKLCQSHSIGVTKLGGYKTKKELIAGIVDKFCCAK